MESSNSDLVIVKGMVHMLMLFGQAMFKALDTKILNLSQFCQGCASISAFVNEQEPSPERKQDTG